MKESEVIARLTSLVDYMNDLWDREEFDRQTALEKMDDGVKRLLREVLDGRSRMNCLLCNSYIEFTQATLIRLPSGMNYRICDCLADETEGMRIWIEAVKLRDPMRHYGNAWVDPATYREHFEIGSAGTINGRKPDGSAFFCAECENRVNGKPVGYVTYTDGIKPVCGTCKPVVLANGGTVNVQPF